MSKLRENWLACTKKCRALVQLQCFVAALEVECLFYGDLLCRIVILRPPGHPVTFTCSGAQQEIRLDLVPYRRNCQCVDTNF